MDHHELTLAELLDDPMTIAVMAADRVDPVALEVVLSALSLKLCGPKATEPKQIGFAWYANPRKGTLMCAAHTVMAGRVPAIDDCVPDMGEQGRAAGSGSAW